MKRAAHFSVYLQCALFVLCVVPAANVRADLTFAVNTGADRSDDDTGDGVCHTTANNCSLRAAIMEANHMLGPGVARINVPVGSYLLTRPLSGANGDDSGDLNLTQPNSAGQFIAIVGAGASTTIIDGNQLDRLFEIAAGRDASISGVTVRNGRSFGRGGGIRNSGMLTITNCVIEENQAGQEGGGISNENALTILGSTIASNIAQSDGGGLASSGSLTVIGSSIRSNLSLGIHNGGGLDLSGQSSIYESAIYDNASNNGGGILNSNQLSVVNSTISGNRANNNGGGIYNFGSAAIYNTSVIDNDADDDHDQDGGIGGGVYSAIGVGLRFIVVNSMIARNAYVAYVNPNDCDGDLEVYGWNLFGDVVGCAFSGNGLAGRGFVALDTIGPLQANGGPTWTHALLPGSQAINSTFDNLGCVDEGGFTLSTDQRGAPRVSGLRCDVGAFEFGANVDPIFSNGFE